MQPDEEKLLREVLELPDEARAAIAAKLIDSLDQAVDADAEAAWAQESGQFAPVQTSVERQAGGVVVVNANGKEFTACQ